VARKELTGRIYICRLRGMASPRLSPQTLLVLERFLEQPAEWRYGYELSRETGLKSGTLYPILMRLAKYELLETKWVATEEGVPPRHTYRLTTKGMELSRAQQKPERSVERARRVALSGGKA
jgi:PadR family transcriptional regulator, regulatory protein PadR